ncbi:hypothetical protein [Streptomyces luteireticuli]|uniref:hypothetical protein n=1 Tax=Streptomyces luteireticuli TaxID=173858 RepID=UPI0031DCA372
MAPARGELRRALAGWELMAIESVILVHLLAYMVQPGDLAPGDGEARHVQHAHREPTTTDYDAILAFTSGEHLRPGATDTVRVERTWPASRPWKPSPLRHGTD